MKKLIIIFLLIFISACNISNKEDVLKDIKRVVNNSKEGYELISNNYLELFDYYLPSDVSEVECGTDYCVFNYDNSKIYMNINISGIIAEKYYKDNMIVDDDFLSVEKIIYHDSGLIKKDDTNIPFYLNVYEYDNIYFVHYYNNEVNIYASSLLNELPSLIKRIFILDSGINIEKDYIIANYSNKAVIDYEKKPVDLFEYIVPSEGILEELIVEKEADN